MAISQIGAVIRRRRLELGLSQEDLADGVCSVTTLSRIENGERMPTHSHVEILLQRLGYSDLMFQSFLNEEDFIAHDLKFKIRQAYIENNFSAGLALLEQFKSLVKKPSATDEQFMVLNSIILDRKQYPFSEKQLQDLEQALCLTHPQYRDGHLPELLSYEEILLLNTIANTQYICGRLQKSIEILYHIIAFYDTHMSNIEEALRTEPMVLYNLSKYLGLEGRYDECIAVCDRGIKLAQVTGRCSCLSQTLYNKAWALVKRNGAGDQELAMKAATRAYNVAEALDNQRNADHIRKFIEDNQLL